MPESLLSFPSCGFVVACSWQGAGTTMGGQHARIRLTLCTEVGVSAEFALQVAHRAPELEITQAPPVSPLPGEEQSLSCSQTTGTDPLGSRRVAPPELAVATKICPVPAASSPPTHHHTAALPHTQLTCSMWGKMSQKQPGKTGKAKVISSQCLY